jgi:ferritin-like metal-binding protein YciE
MNTLRETFVDELMDIYDAEKQLLKALPKLAEAADSEELKEGIEAHLEESEGHVNRLEKVFEAIDEKAKGRKCKAMKGLIEEASELIEEEAGDAALICAAQKVEHYEIATYGSLKSWADLLEEQEAAELLAQTLEEEKAADEKLTKVAESTVNAEESEEEETAKSFK